MKSWRCIAVLLAMLVSVLSFTCPVDDPTTAYNESETPICVATPASVNSNLQMAADYALEAHSVTASRVIRTNDEDLTITLPVIHVPHSLLELFCTLLC